MDVYTFTDGLTKCLKFRQTVSEYLKVETERSEINMILYYTI